MPIAAALGSVEVSSHHYVCGGRIYVVRYAKSKRIAAVVTYTPWRDAPSHEKFSSTHINNDPFSINCVHCQNAYECVHALHVREYAEQQQRDATVIDQEESISSEDLALIQGVTGQVFGAALADRQG